MFQLILTVVSLALFSVLVVAAISYAPWWYKTAETADAVTRSSLKLVEQAYDVAARLDNGTVPAVATDQVDGGFVSIFQPILKVLPATPSGFTWKYGAANGLNYFCLESTRAIDEGTLRGVFRAKGLFSESQVVIGASCAPAVPFTERPSDSSAVALTMYVAFVPGISK